MGWSVPIFRPMTSLCAKKLPKCAHCCSQLAIQIQWDMGQIRYMVPLILKRYSHWWFGKQKWPSAEEAQTTALLLPLLPASHASCELAHISHIQFLCSQGGNTWWKSPLPWTFDSSSHSLLLVMRHLSLSLSLLWLLRKTNRRRPNLFIWGRKRGRG